ncbi:MAG: two-component system, LytTR family, sensor histidine kinase LytS [Clostridia bacterium]|jgi:two-component system sensor histidine kinase LytS|nr:two-component system, LytTR family, sensor histidine kinase LytS [Clostridia bacterium]MDN5323453.1 two-component system, LytTR family, sensor histidine kinase LytS [Clostridia bacterium]
MKELFFFEQNLSAMYLFVKLFEAIGIIGLGAYFFTQSRIFKNLFKRKITIKERILMIIFFGVISMAGTYLGIPIKGALANTRAVGAIVAGLFGGPAVGLGAGFIAGLHRYFLGGYTGFACGLATTIEGFLAGFLPRITKNEEISTVIGLAAGILGEALQMIIILAVAKPFNEALELVQIIALPMMTVNSFGIVLFIHLVNKSKSDLEKIEALQAHKALKIANQTISHLRHGLNHHSANITANIILNMSEVDAVAITDKYKILAHVGIASDHHIPNSDLLTALTNQVIKTGELTIANIPEEIGCKHRNCPLGSAVVVPLKIRNEVVGTLKFYHSKSKSISPVKVELAKGLAQLLSTQLELGQLEAQAKLKTTAELKALQAQINPHFLFNALNTIIFFSRNNPETSRQLLIHLSEFFRKTLKNDSDFVSLNEELALIKSYLTIEKARFGDRLEVKYQIPQELLNVKIPTFILQPLVENAIKHGIAPKIEGGKIIIKVTYEGKKLYFSVCDTGVGIPRDQKEKIFVKGFGKGIGIGLSNINERLKAIYGSEYCLKIEDNPDMTQVWFYIPYNSEVAVNG